MFSFLVSSALSLKREPTQPFVIWPSKEVEGGGCYRIPSAVTTAKGTVITLADYRPNNCGDLNGNNNIKIVAKYSYDNGMTWSDKKFIAAYESGKSCPTVLQF